MIRHMIRLGLAASLVLGAAIAGAAESGTNAKTAPAQEARIPFAALGGINNWVADGETGLYIEGIRHQWYHAKLMGDCLDLPYVEHIGFVMEPDSSFDKFSSIVVRGHVCQVASMVKSEAPSKVSKAKKTQESSTD